MISAVGRILSSIICEKFDAPMDLTLPVIMFSRGSTGFTTTVRTLYLTFLDQRFHILPSFFQIP